MRVWVEGEAGGSARMARRKLRKKEGKMEIAAEIVLDGLSTAAV